MLSPRFAADIQRKQILDYGGLSIPHLNLRAAGQSKKRKWMEPREENEGIFQRENSLLASYSNCFVYHYRSPMHITTFGIRTGLINACISIRKRAAVKFANLNERLRWTDRGHVSTVQKICARSTLAAGIHGRRSISFHLADLIGNPADSPHAPAMFSSSSESSHP